MFGTDIMRVQRLPRFHINRFNRKSQNSLNIISMRLFFLLFRRSIDNGHNYVKKISFFFFFIRFGYTVLVKLNQFNKHRFFRPSDLSKFYNRRIINYTSHIQCLFFKYFLQILPVKYIIPSQLGCLSGDNFYQLILNG